MEEKIVPVAPLPGASRLMPHYQDSEVTLFHGDCLEVLRSLPDASVDSIVTDPPYGLGKEPDALAMLQDWITHGVHEVKGRGFMGKEWDAFVPQPAQWKECFRILKPGGHLLAFAGTRTQDLMALGLRIAGFEIRDLIAWVYGSGFPKSLDVSKALDAKELFGKSNAQSIRARSGREIGNVGTNMNTHRSGANDIDPGFVENPLTTEAAKKWEGWGTALKPTLEPITMARKPLIGTVAENVLAHGTGAINVDGCRVGTDPISQHDRKGDDFGFTSPEPAGRAWSGRWPANLIHDGSEEVVSLFPGYGEDSAARFFYTAKASKEDRDEGLERQSWTSAGAMTGGRAEGSAGLNNPRAGAGRTSGGKNIHPTVKPTALMQYLCRLVTPPGGLVLDPFMGSGSTGKAALLEGFRFIGIEREADYLPIAQKRVLSARQESVAVRHIDLQGSLL